MKENYVYDETDGFLTVQSINLLGEKSNAAGPHRFFTLLILYEAGVELMVDDIKIRNDCPSIIFITPGQHLYFSGAPQGENHAVSFNRDFYCIEIHDAEVSCNGLLFVNNYSIVQIKLDTLQQQLFSETIREMKTEFSNHDAFRGEMLKNLLKNLLIRSNRLFRKQLSKEESDHGNFEFARKFSQLVEKHFHETRNISDYADKMGIAADTLTKKLQKLGYEAPSFIIRQRIMTEAKRLLIYTGKSVKEIALETGFDDNHYFSRLFSKETGFTPVEFRQNHRIA